MRELLTQQTANLLKVRAFILKKAREYLDKQGFFEVQGPILVPLSAGSSNSFEVNYYDSKVCLTKGLLPGNTEKPELTRSADLLAPEGYGEVASSIELLNGAKLQSRLEQAHISKDKQDWLLKFYEDNSIQYSSFAMGIERLLQWICKLEKIEQTTPLTSIKHH